MYHGAYNINGQTMQEVGMGGNIFVGGVYKFSMVATGGFCSLRLFECDSRIILIAGRQAFMEARERVGRSFFISARRTIGTDLVGRGRWNYFLGICNFITISLRVIGRFALYRVMSLTVLYVRQSGLSLGTLRRDGGFICVVASGTVNIGGFDIGVTSVRFFRVMFAWGVGGRDSATCGQLYVLDGFLVFGKVVFFGFEGRLSFTAHPFGGEFCFLAVYFIVSSASYVC